MRYFTFRRDPRDIFIVCFWNPELARYEPIPYRNAAQPPITLWKLRAARRYLREQRKPPDAQHGEAMIFNAVCHNREMIEAALVRKGKMKATDQLGPGVHSGQLKTGDSPATGATLVGKTGGQQSTLPKPPTPRCRD